MAARKTGIKTALRAAHRELRRLLQDTPRERRRAWRRRHRGLTDALRQLVRWRLDHGGDYAVFAELVAYIDQLRRDLRRCGVQVTLPVTPWWDRECARRRDWNATDADEPITLPD